MPTLAAKASATRQASFFLQKPSPLLAPVILAPYVSFRHKDAIANGCKKIFEARSTQSGTSIVATRSNLPALPKCSIRASVGSAHQQLHACASKGNLASTLSASSTSLFGDQDSILHGIPSLPRRQKSLKAPNAYKNDFFKFKQPVLTEKPEWWWRTLACVPYLIALQISYTGYFLQPFVEHYDKFGDLIYFVPGAITRLPPWFTMVYSYFIYIGVVKNKEWPHFCRFHVMMGMLLEILLQVIWTTCNFFPLIHYDGKFGMYFWAGVGLAYIVTSLQCITCALAGGYAHLPFVSDASYIHTLFNIGGFQRPF